VDAVCIDQSNLDEKSEQVQMMATIYRQAARVLCWIGEHDKRADLAFDSVQELCWAIKARLWQYCSTRLGIPISQVTESAITLVLESDRSSLSLEHGPLRALYHEGMFDSFMAALALIPIDFSSCRSLSEIAVATFGKSRTFVQTLLSDSGSLSDNPLFEDKIMAIYDTFTLRKYWKRVWILQEIMHAKEATIICGRRWMDFRARTVLGILFYEQRRSTAVGGSLLIPAFDTREVIELMTSSITRLMSIYPGQETSESLSDRIFLFSDCASSEPRDAIYALLNISDPIDIIPDYKKLPADVYTDSTRSIIRQEKNLDIIYWTAFQSIPRESMLPRDVNLPSWVPQFNADLMPRNCRTRGDPIHEDFLPYCTLSDDDIERTLSVAENRILRLTGCFYGTLNIIAPRFTTDFTVTTPSFPPEEGEEDSNLPFWLLPVLFKEPFESDLDFWRALLTDKYLDNTGKDVELADSDEALSNLDIDLHLKQTTYNAPVRLRKALNKFTSDKAFCKASNK